MIKQWKNQPPIFRYQVYQYLIVLGLLTYMVIRKFPTLDFLIIGFLCFIGMGITHIRSMTIGMNLISTNDFIRRIIQKPLENEEENLMKYFNFKDLDDKLKN